MWWQKKMKEIFKLPLFDEMCVHILEGVDVAKKCINKFIWYFSRLFLKFYFGSLLMSSHSSFLYVFYLCTFIYYMWCDDELGWTWDIIWISFMLNHLMIQDSLLFSQRNHSNSFRFLHVVRQTKDDKCLTINFKKI